MITVTTAYPNIERALASLKRRLGIKEECEDTLEILNVKLPGYSAVTAANTGAAAKEREKERDSSRLTVAATAATEDEDVAFVPLDKSSFVSKDSVIRVSLSRTHEKGLSGSIRSRPRIWDLPDEDEAHVDSMCDTAPCACSEIILLRQKRNHILQLAKGKVEDDFEKLLSRYDEQKRSNVHFISSGLSDVKANYQSKRKVFLTWQQYVSGRVCSVVNKREAHRRYLR